ncbi:MAG: PLP-dependent aminotransferase family protein [Clostridia bacterium]|nr:PLP-dependent aminotransferase family protein [Clostridia bacterium]
MKEKKYIEIYKNIKTKIMYEEYKSGEKLPSKRVTADKYGCSVITVETAYGMLADEGYILPKERSGYYVCDSANLIDSNFSHEKKPFVYLSEDNTGDENKNFEYSLWFKTIRKVLSEKGEKLFKKSPNMGCAVLRNAIADYLLRYRGMYAEPQRIIIGSGAEQLYETVVKILGRDKVYGIENPSYSRIEEVYKSEGVKIKKLKMGADGIESKELNSDIDVLHVTPFCSYPTGVTTSVSKRYEYLKWATSDKYIVEDDFNSEFFIPGQPIKTLYDLGNNQSVIYINTFSKSLSPSMRMGYMILPERLIKIYEEKMGSFSCTVPVLDQYILGEYIASGNFERHLNRVRRKRGSY